MTERKIRFGKKLCSVAFVLSMCAFGGIGADAQPAPAASGNIVNLQAGRSSGQLVVPVDQSQLLNVDRRFGEISVGNKDIADVVPLSRNLIYVLGKKRGTTNLTITEA